MSLISEALKKARGDQPGPWAVAHPPPRRTVGPWLTAAVAVGVAAGVVIGVFVRRDSAADGKAMPVDVATAGPATPGAPAPAASPAPSPSAAGSRTPAAERETTIQHDGSESAAKAAGPTALDGRDSPPAPPEARDREATAQAPAGVDRESVEAQAPPQTAPAPEAEPVPTSAPTQPIATTPLPETGPTDGASYHREVTLPGGTRLALGGIAWSEGSPAALVNGQVLGPGEGGGDWMITAVERDRVEVEWRGVRFFLRLK